MNDLDRLKIEAAKVDSMGSEQEEQEQSASPEQMESLDRTAALAKELEMLGKVLLGVLTPALPSLKEIYTEPVVKTLCESTARVMVKYKLFENGIGGRWAEEIALAAIALPLAFATYKGVKTDIAGLKAKAEKPAPQKPDLEIVSNTNERN